MVLQSSINLTSLATYKRGSTHSVPTDLVKSLTFNIVAGLGKEGCWRCSSHFQNASQEVHGILKKKTVYTGEHLSLVHHNLNLYKTCAARIKIGNIGWTIDII